MLRQPNFVKKNTSCLRERYGHAMYQCLLFSSFFRVLVARLLPCLFSRIIYSPKVSTDISTFRSSDVLIRNDVLRLPYFLLAQGTVSDPRVTC